MDPRFFRRYRDLIAETEELDEGMVDNVKSMIAGLTGKVKQAIPNFSELYREITPMMPQLKQIMSSAGTAEEVSAEVQKLAQQYAAKVGSQQSQAKPTASPTTPGATMERVGDILPSTGWVAATAGVIGIGGMIAEAIKVIGALMTVGSLGGALQILAIPAISVLTILWVIYELQKQTK
jgi:hypothetical protein